MQPQPTGMPALGNNVLWAKDLTIHDRKGQLLLGPVSFAAARGELVAVNGGTSVQRALLAAAVTGRLRDRSHRVSGELIVDGRNRLRRIAKRAALVEVRLDGEAKDLADLRIAELTRASSTGVPLVAVSPGTEGLGAVDATRLAWAARHLADHGRAVLVSVDGAVELPTASRILDLTPLRAY